MAKGSMTLGGWEPKVGQKLSWHVPCEQVYGSPFDKDAA